MIINSKKGRIHARFKLVDGVSVQLTVTKKQRQKQAYTNGALIEQSAELRAKRNRLLAETDFWNIISDVTMSISDMKTYRQNLKILHLVYQRLR